jgi:type I restriction enzyme S subunit
MSWRVRKLEELVDHFSVRAKDYGGANDLEFLGVSNEDGITKSKYAAEDKAEDYKIIEKGCFAYNPYRINVGSIAYLNDNIKGLISPAYVIFKPKKNSIRPELLLKFLKSSEGLRQIKLHARGTVRQALRFEDLCKIELNLPDYTEQEKLIERYDITEQASEVISTELTHQQDLVKQLRQAFLREAMQGKLVKQDPKDGHAKDLLEKIKAEKQTLVAEKKIKKEKELLPIKPEEIPFEIPKNWAWCRLEYLLDPLRGLSYGVVKPSRNDPNGVIFIKSGDIGDFYVEENIKTKITLELDQEYKRTKIRGGEILITLVGASIGRCSIVPDSLIGANVSRAVGVCSITKLIDKQFFLYVLYYSIQALINDNSLDGSNRPVLNLETIKNIPFFLPPFDEQTRIVKKLQELMSLCDALQSNIQNSQQQNQQLLQQVLREALQAN